MGKLVKNIKNAVGSMFGVPQARKQAEAIQAASSQQATAIKEQADSQAAAVQQQVTAQQNQIKDQQVAANQAMQANVDQRNLTTALSAQMATIKDTSDKVDDAPVKVDLSVPTAADAADPRRKYQSGAAVGGSGSGGGVGIRVG